MTQVTKAMQDKTYSFKSRWETKEQAKQEAQKLNGEKHAYYTKIKEKGVDYFDVRIEN